MWIARVLSLERNSFNLFDLEELVCFSSSPCKIQVNSAIHKNSSIQKLLRYVKNIATLAGAELASSGTTQRQNHGKHRSLVGDKNQLLCRSTTSLHAMISIPSSFGSQEDVKERVNAATVNVVTGESPEQQSRLVVKLCQEENGFGQRCTVMHRGAHGQPVSLVVAGRSTEGESFKTTHLKSGSLAFDSNQCAVWFLALVTLLFTLRW